MISPFERGVGRLTNRGRRLAAFSADYVLNLIKSGAPPITLAGHDHIKVGIKRLWVFKEKGLACARCRITGTFFALEQHKPGGNRGYDTPHLNLYAIAAGKDVLMTVDHIVALADGGSKEMDNLQTMCAPCNHSKGSLKGGRRAWPGE